MAGFLCWDLIRLPVVYTLATFSLLAVLRAEDGPWMADLGKLKIRPYGFLDVIETSRTATMANTVSTPLGSVPLSSTGAQNLASLRHSRLMLNSELRLESVTFRTYLEGDFMNAATGQLPYRWRQYWGQMKIGKWEVLGGKAWSLLRPNRKGIASDVDMMNTDVIEPAYHVGLVGARRRQIRLTRSFARNMTAAVAWEGVGNTVAKLAQDRKKLHWELQALSGIQGRRGAGFAATYAITKSVRLVSQEFWSRHAISEALGVAPAGADGISVIQGAEVQVRPGWEVYGYAGVVRASRAVGNRSVGEWSVGMNRNLTAPLYGARVRVSLEFSHLDRVTWQNRSGQMNYVMAALRYSIN